MQLELTIGLHVKRTAKIMFCRTGYTLGPMSMWNVRANMLKISAAGRPCSTLRPEKSNPLDIVQWKCPT